MEPTNDLEQACAQVELRLQRYPWSEAASKSGLGRGALYLVRPDGHAGPAVVPPRFGIIRRALALVLLSRFRHPGPALAKQDRSRWAQRMRLPDHAPLDDLAEVKRWANCMD
jgi:hypothetical protein